MDLSAFRWLRKPGHVLAGLSERPALVHGLVVEPLDGLGSLWLPFPVQSAPLPKLPPGALPLFPSAKGDVHPVIDAWLRLYAEASKGMEEAVLQVHDDAAHLRDYLAAERDLWARIYAAHPHKEDPGILPRALDEAEWLLDAVLGHADYAERNEFLTQSVFETVARELLITVRRAEMQHLREHLRGQDTVSGW